MGFRNTLAGSGFVVLNVIRAINVIALVLTMAASMAMVVKTIISSSFYIFDGITHFITFFVAMFLVITELGLFSNYVARNWPLFSIEHGFVTLAFFMITISVSTLGNLNKEATSSTEIGPGFYGLVMAAGILTFIMGFANLIANYMFRNPKKEVTARMVRLHGKQAHNNVNYDVSEWKPTLQPMEPQLKGAEKYAPSSIYSSPSRGSLRSHVTRVSEHTAVPSHAYSISRPLEADIERGMSAGQYSVNATPRRPESVVHPAMRGSPF